MKFIDIREVKHDVYGKRQDEISFPCTAILATYKSSAQKSRSLAMILHAVTSNAVYFSRVVAYATVYVFCHFSNTKPYFDFVHSFFVPWLK